MKLWKFFRWWTSLEKKKLFVQYLNMTFCYFVQQEKSVTIWHQKSLDTRFRIYFKICVYFKVSALQIINPYYRFQLLICIFAFFNMFLHQVIPKVLYTQPNLEILAAGLFKYVCLFVNNQHDRVKNYRNMIFSVLWTFF